MNAYRTGDGWGALADGTRRAIVMRLAERPMAVGELAAGLPVTRSAVSQHLKILKDAGLVSERAAGTRRIYRLNPVAVAALRDQLDTFWQRALAGYTDTVAAATRTTERGELMTRPMLAWSASRSSSQASIDRAFAVFTERFGDFKPPEHNLLAAPIAETVFEPTVGGNIIDRAVDGSECRWARILAYEPPQPGGVQLGHQPAVADRDRPGPDQRGRGPVLHRNPERAPGWNWSTATSTGTVPAGKPSATASTATRDGRFTWPVTRPCSPGQTEWRRSPPPPRSTGQPRRSSHYATDPTRFSQWQKGVVDGRIDHAGAPQVGARCLTTRRIGGANRPSTSRSPHQPTPHLGRPRNRRADPRHRRPHRRAAQRDTVTAHHLRRLRGHGIGKVLVPLLVRRQAQREMPSNLAMLKQRLEAPTS